MSRRTIKTQDNLEVKETKGRKPIQRRDGGKVVISGACSSAQEREGGLVEIHESRRRVVKPAPKRGKIARASIIKAIENLILERDS